MADVPNPLGKEETVAEADHFRNVAGQTSPGEVRVIAEPSPSDTLGDDVVDDARLVLSADPDLKQPLQTNVEPVPGMLPEVRVNGVDVGILLDADAIRVTVELPQSGFGRARLKHTHLIELVWLQCEHGDSMRVFGF